MRREEVEVGEVRAEDMRKEGSVIADCRPMTAHTMDPVPLSNRQLQGVRTGWLRMPWVLLQVQEPQWILIGDAEDMSARESASSVMRMAILPATALAAVGALHTAALFVASS